MTETDPIETDAGPAHVARFEVVHEEAANRFALRRDGELVSFADYRRDADAMVLVVPHVETIPRHRGQGYAARLMDGLLEIMRSNGQQIVALCPFAADHIRANPEHHDLLR